MKTKSAPALLPLRGQVTKPTTVKWFRIYHTSQQYFRRALIGQLGGDQPSTIHLRAADEKQNGFRRFIVTNKAALWAASYSGCVVYTKTIIHLSVGESGGYTSPQRLGKYPPLFPSTSVNNC